MGSAIITPKQSLQNGISLVQDGLKHGKGAVQDIASDIEALEASKDSR